MYVLYMKTIFGMQSNLCSLKSYKNFVEIFRASMQTFAKVLTITTRHSLVQATAAIVINLTL